MQTTLSFFLKTSRPRFWIYLLGPWLVGSLFNAQSPLEIVSSTQFWLGLLMFSWPANFFLYGVNDLADVDTDALNQKKSSYERRMHQSEIGLLYLGLATTLILFIWFMFAIPTASAAATAMFLLLSASYSLSPLRFKARPLIDAYSNILYALPAFASASLSPQGLRIDSLQFWAVVLAVLTWNAGMHTYSAIPDIHPDRIAGLQTTAVWLGERRALLFVIFNWAVTSLIALLVVGWAATPFMFYPLFAWSIRTYHFSVATYYPYFPKINLVLGLYLYWLIFSQMFTFSQVWQDTLSLFPR